MEHLIMIQLIYIYTDVTNYDPGSTTTIPPNTEVRLNGDSLFLYSTGIEANCEITVDYSNSENLIGYKANINF